MAMPDGWCVKCTEIAVKTHSRVEHLAVRYKGQPQLLILIVCHNLQMDAIM